jgi:hypothetical protein
MEGEMGGVTGESVGRRRTAAAAMAYGWDPRREVDSFSSDDRVPCRREVGVRVRGRIAETIGGGGDMGVGHDVAHAVGV